MTEIVLAHDQKHVPGHYFSVGPNVSPKRTPEQLSTHLPRAMAKTSRVNYLMMTWNA